MNIQIFGTKKCFDTKKAERYFKERNIKYQLIDLKEKGMSKGEYTSVKQAVGGLDVMLNDDCKDKDALALIKYIAAEDRDEKVLENQKALSSPLARNGKKATIGYQPEVWKTWDETGLNYMGLTRLDLSHCNLLNATYSIQFTPMLRNLPQPCPTQPNQT